MIFVGILIVIQKRILAFSLLLDLIWHQVGQVVFREANASKDLLYLHNLTF